MDYEEFLWAIGDTSTFSLLKRAFESGRSLGDSMNRKLLRDFRLDMLVGGMPQAVNKYIQTNNFRKVDRIKRDILSLYTDDFKKIDPTGKLSYLFDAIPAQLNKNAARYQVSSVLKDERAESVLELIAELKDSKTVLVSYHANDPNYNQEMSQKARLLSGFFRVAYGAETSSRKQVAAVYLRG